MATVEQGFSIPTVKERDELALAGEAQLWTPGSINAAAARAAKVANLVLRVDERWAADTFTGQLEAMDLKKLPEDMTPVASVVVGAEGNDGQALTPSHVVKGHDGLKTRNGDTIPETHVWKDMFAGRPAEWWNKTRAEGESQLVEAPLRLVLADTALRGLGQNWTKQQAELSKLIKDHKSDTTALEGMTPLDWVMMDADAIVGGSERPDRQTLTRFVQHEQDRSGALGAYGPVADVGGDRVYLRGSRGYPDSDVGFRAVMGQKQVS